MNPSQELAPELIDAPPARREARVLLRALIVGLLLHLRLGPRALHLTQKNEVEPEPVDTVELAQLLDVERETRPHQAQHALAPGTIVAGIEPRGGERGGRFRPQQARSELDALELVAVELLLPTRFRHGSR